MKIAPKCQNENQRLSALLKYEILDTEPEPRFDEVTKLAATLCDKPVALVSLIDENRQWFKSCVGTDVKETPRHIAFCAHALSSKTIMIVPNALEDERFFDNPLVTSDPKIRFYAGSPLITPEGYIIGTLCVLDTKPGSLDDKQINALAVLANQVVDQLELKLKNRFLEKLNTQKYKLIRLMSHDLRSAFSANIGYSKMLNKTYTKKETDRTEELTTKIQNTAKQGLDLLNNLLSWSSMQQHKNEIENSDCRIYAIFSDVIEYFQTDITSKNLKINIECEKDLIAKVNQALIRSVVQNLMHNAIKFSQTDGEITVSAFETEKSFEFGIRDTGVGISEENSKTLFSTKNQSTFGTAGESGSGVGTQIIRDFILLYDGAVEVTSEPNKGTDIHISLPK